MLRISFDRSMYHFRSNVLLITHDRFRKGAFRPQPPLTTSTRARLGLAFVTQGKAKQSNTQPNTAQHQHNTTQRTHITTQKGKRSDEQPRSDSGKTRHQISPKTVPYIPCGPSRRSMHFRTRERLDPVWRRPSIRQNFGSQSTTGSPGADAKGFTESCHT